LLQAAHALNGNYLRDWSSMRNGEIGHKKFPDNEYNFNFPTFCLSLDHLKVSFCWIFLVVKVSVYQPFLHERLWVNVLLLCHIGQLKVLLQVKC